MPVLRRYCRVSKYTVLEVRIYLDNPADLNTWLLSPRYNILPRIFRSIKPHVLPKLKEERERNSGGKGKSAKPVNDVVVEDDYEVSIFLTNSGTRHTVITKRKVVGGSTNRGSGGKMGKMTGGVGVPAQVRREEDDSDGGGVINLEDIPEAPPPETSGLLGSSTTKNPPTSRRNKRESLHPQSDTNDKEGEEEEEEGSDGDSDSDPFEPPSKRLRKTARVGSMKPTITIRDEGDDADSDWSENGEGESEDKKKLSLRTEFEGFSIYSRILCLVVKRRGPISVGRAPAGSSSTPSSARQMDSPNPKTRPGNQIMENWIAMSQAVKEGDDED
ncbi:hypothetical protein L873DRAFT_595957 [Choiromyces venosus 120613-1]|uniref:Uncharacterized protein n=1 Tax=Choiromyces venosus 120613-1 TaxID=1336337 RepID=A0A3N4JU45_9PEZI|nr:hypothetical protein L873DRAFT_595957 [Choiromyces venosus 120613-1]